MRSTHQLVMVRRTHPTKLLFFVTRIGINSVSEGLDDTPTISMFYGIFIKMFFDDHAPPHFHVEYAEFKAVVDIQKLEISEGHLPRRAQVLVMDWAELHQQELLDDWNLCAAKQPPNPIRPLL